MKKILTLSLCVCFIISGFTFADCPSADFTGDCFVNFDDFAIMAEWWLEDCNSSNNFCEGADSDTSGDIGWFDFTVLTNNWLDVAYLASYYLDDFNDNTMGSIWALMDSNESVFWLDETNQRLEARSTGLGGPGDHTAAYVPNGWHLDTSQDFGFKIRYHNEVESTSWSELLFALADPSDCENNHLQFSVCSIYTGLYFYYELRQNDFLIDELYIPRVTNDGWIFISYDAELDNVYLGIDGYGSSNAVKTVSGLLQGDWAGKYIGPHIGGGSDHVEMVSGQAFWDDFIVDYGEILSE